MNEFPGLNSKSKICQNCKNDFIIEPEDFAFYEKIKVPTPTFCPECRLQRRLIFRNERTLYKRRCDAPGHKEEIVSIYSKDSLQKVYDHKYWWGDEWDALEFGVNYDFTRPFFEQLKDLWHKTPDSALLNINPVNSEYCSYAEGNKNSYLVVGGDFNENVLYSGFAFYCQDSCDLYWVSRSNLNYETVDCVKCYNLLYGRYCEECQDSYFMFDCKNCMHCFGCVGLRNKKYCLFNEQLNEEEYKKRIVKYNLGKYEVVQELRKIFSNHVLKYPRRFAKAIKAINSTGNQLEETKDCQNSFDVFGGGEDSKHIWLTSAGFKDCYDCDHLGLKSELSYECSSLYPGSNVLFSKNIINCHDIQYSFNCYNSSYLFGCVQIRNKHYCILNKQYSKEDYFKLVEKIKTHMNEMPYVDKLGRVYKYGEFFPSSLSVFAYNETIAHEIFPLNKDGVLEKNFSWKFAEQKNYQPTIQAKELPDDIINVGNYILEEIIACAHEGKCNEQCTEAFKITNKELDFYKRMRVPLPRLCPNCRHYQRLKQRNPLKLWHRKCMKPGCTNEFETSYAPDRPEIVYCEKCYQQEVY